MDEYYEKLIEEIEANPKLKECTDLLKKSNDIYKTLSEEEKEKVHHFLDTFELDKKKEEGNGEEDKTS